MPTSYSLAPSFRWAFLDNLGNKAANGTIGTYRDMQRSDKKETYQDPGGIAKYENPIRLNDFGEVGQIYWANDEAYYIEVRDRYGALIATIESYTPQGGGGAPVTNLIPIANHVLNGQFRFYAQAEMTGLPITAFEVADGWEFIKNNATGTDKVKIIPFPMGGVAGVEENPTNYIEYSCSDAGAGESIKDIWTSFHDVISFQGEMVSFSFSAKSPSSSPIELVIAQDFGTGGTPSTTVRTNVVTFSLTSAWQRYTATFALPSVTGKVKGTDGNDRVKLTLAMPLNTVCTVQFTNVQLELGELANPFQYRTYDIERALLAPEYFSTGDTKHTLKATAAKGWVMMDNKSIGNFASGATGRANSDTWPLYKLIWGTAALADAPMQDAAGEPVVERGTTAEADWAANRRIQLLFAVGRTLAATGTFEGMTARVAATTAGAESVTLTKATTSPHEHGVMGAGATQPYEGGGFHAYTPPLQYIVTGNGVVEGLGGQAHENMQPTLFLNLMIKL